MNANCQAKCDRVLFGYAPGLFGTVVVDGRVLFVQAWDAGCRADFVRWTARGIAHGLGVSLHEVILRKKDLPERWSYIDLAAIVTEKAREDTGSDLPEEASLAIVPLAA